MSLHTASMQLSALGQQHKSVAGALLPSPYKLGRVSFNKPVVQKVQRKQQRCTVGACLTAPCRPCTCRHAIHPIDTFIHCELIGGGERARGGGVASRLCQVGWSSATARFDRVQRLDMLDAALHSYFVVDY